MMRYYVKCANGAVEYELATLSGCNKNCARLSPIVPFRNSYQDTTSLSVGTSAVLRFLGGILTNFKKARVMSI